MKNTYVVKTESRFLAFYYGEGRAIYMDEIKEDKIAKKKVIENVYSCFSVSIDKKGKIYIFCKKEEGDLMLITEQQGSFNISILFKKDILNLPNNVIFTPLFFENNTSFIFNYYDNITMQNFISIKTFVENRGFSKKENIDTFSISDNNIFEIQKIKNNDLVMIYEKRDKEIQLGYKQLLNGKFSEYVPFCKTGYNIIDFSFFASYNSIHFLYIVKNIFSCHVVYRKKDENGLTSPTILYEGQNIKSCNIALIDNSIYCMYVIGSSLFYTISKDFGASFLPALKHKKAFSQQIIKANFITNIEDESTIFNYIYTDYKAPLNIQLIQEIPYFQNIRNNRKDDFISDLSNQHILPNKDNDNEKYNNYIEIDKKYRIVEENDFMAQFNPELFKNIINDKTNNLRQENLNIIKNKLEIAKRQLNEKNKEIINITKAKDEEEKRLKEKLKYLEEENKKLNKSLMHEKSVEKNEQNIKYIKEDKETK